MKAKLSEAESSGEPNTSTITVNIKFSGRLIPISLSPDTTVKDLKSQLQPLTDVLPRGMKLIFKGKLLVDTMTLKSSEVSNGSKIMLLASHGLHQGDGPITKDAFPPPNTGKIIHVNRTVQSEAKIPIEKSQSERWKITGVVPLSACNLKVVPEEIWDLGASVRVLDVSNNHIQEIPAKISSLRSVQALPKISTSTLSLHALGRDDIYGTVSQKLVLNANDILDESISWEGIASLGSLAVLFVSQNRLTALPAEIGALTSLQQLHIANNRLQSLPAEIGLLTNLQILKANNNRLSSIPSSIGNCCSLSEVDFSSNCLVELPETLGNIRNLKALYLCHNGLKSLPTTLFKLCSQLSTLDIHNTEITVDRLRQFPGWADFDERRRLKHQKQLDFHVGDPTGFDEGADKNDGT